MNLPPEQGPPMSPGPAVPPAGTVGAGPRILTFSGVAVLLVAVAAGVLAAVLFARAVPFDLLTPSGEPGPGALGVADVPGSTDAVLPETGTYAIWEVGPDPEARAVSAADITVADQAGTTLPVGRAAFSGDVSAGGAHGRLVAQFRADAGPATVEVSSAGAPDGTYVVVAESQDFGGFFATLGGSVVAWFVALGGGMLGLLVTAGGIVWWVLRRNAGRPAGAAPRNLDG
ncbi:hypothetical protein GCM10028784_19060 [Myceligenerans cantabricum]